MKKIELFWDVGSPYTYLASTQIASLRAKSRAEIVLRPFLLGGVFKATGNKMIDVAPKAKNLMEDLTRWAKLYDVKMRVPGFDSVPFPINSLQAMRCATAAQLESPAEGEALMHTLMKAYWVDGKDLSDRAVLESVAGSKWMAASDLQPNKDALRKTTEEAVERGVYGAPTFFVGEQLFWGNDRIHFVEAAARG